MERDALKRALTAKEAEVEQLASKSVGEGEIVELAAKCCSLEALASSLCAAVCVCVCVCVCAGVFVQARVLARAFLYGADHAM